MGKEINFNNIKDFETTNRILNALMDRIEILNRLIESKDMISLEGIESVNSSSVQSIGLNNDNQEIEEELQMLREELEKKEKQLENKLELENQLEEKDSRIQQLSQIEECVENPYNMYVMYRNFNEDVKAVFSGLIIDDDITKFITSVATKDNLDSLYDRIVSYVMNGSEKIEQNGIFDVTQRQISKLFEFYYKIVSYRDSIYDFDRLDVKTNCEYDEDVCVRVGSASGEINDILLQGYRTNDNMCKRTIVFVK